MKKIDRLSQNWADYLTVRISQKSLLTAVMLYIYIPVFLFVIGWIKAVYALVFTATFCFCFYRLSKTWKREECRNDFIELDLLVGIGVFLMFMVVGYYAGWGRFVDQPGDWEKHNAILRDLVTRGWPVYYVNESEYSMLSYYIGQYLIPASFGKLVHSYRAAEILLYVYNEIGLYLVFLSVLSLTKQTKLLNQGLCAVAIVFFSIPLWLSKLVLHITTGLNMFGSGQWFYGLIQYSSNYTLLRWVFPQAIPIWLITALLLKYRKHIEYYVFMMLPALLFGSFGFIGLLPLAFAYVIEEAIQNKDIKKLAVRVFSLENILMVATLGILLLMYFYGNVLGVKPDDVALRLMPYTSDTISIYFIFVGVNVIPYAVLLWKSHKTDGIYYASMGVLLVLPLLIWGVYNDLCMRASVPSLFVVMVYAIQFLTDEESCVKTDKLHSYASLLIVILLLVGMYYPFQEMSGSVETEVYSIPGMNYARDSLEVTANRQLDWAENDLKFNYYAYDIEDNLFYRYVAAK